MSEISRLQKLLNSARVSDDEIRGGIRISDAGLQKLGTRMGLEVHEVRAVLAELTERLRSEHNREVTMENAGDPRFAYESDFLGNLTIRDSEKGTEHYVSGSDSAHVIKALRATENGSPAEQAILKQLCNDEETLVEDGTEETSDGFAAELKNDAGSYNFPWRIAHHHGTATVKYSGKSFRDMKLDVVDIRDSRGEQIKVSDRVKAEVTKQARDFIGKE